MSPTPGADIAAPRDPADYRPRALLGPSFWALLMFGLVCILAGVALAILGPKLRAQRTAARPAEAAAALAAAALVEANQGSSAFPEEIDALRAVSPASPEFAQLSRLAREGASSRASLAASFADYAARAASAVRRPGEGAALGGRIGYALSRVVTARRVAESGGTGPDAPLVRAERALDDGDSRTLAQRTAGAAALL